MVCSGRRSRESMPAQGILERVAGQAAAESRESVPTQVVWGRACSPLAAESCKSMPEDAAAACSSSNRLSDVSFGSCIPETPSPVSSVSPPDDQGSPHVHPASLPFLPVEPLAVESDATQSFTDSNCRNEAELARVLVGRAAIRKLFPHYGRFNGVVSSFDAKSGLFKIVYEDADEEEMSLSKIVRYLPKLESCMVKEGLDRQSDGLEVAGPKSRETERQPEALCLTQCPITGFPIDAKLLKKLHNSVQVTKGTLINTLRNRLGWAPEVSLCQGVRVRMHCNSRMICRSGGKCAQTRTNAHFRLHDRVICALWFRTPVVLNACD